MNDKFFVLIFNYKDGIIEEKEISVISTNENKGKHQMESVFPFDKYNYFYEHGLNRVHSTDIDLFKKIYYIVSTNKEDTIKVYDQNLERLINYKKNEIEKFERLKRR